jgi:hypothetical protein
MTADVIDQVREYHALPKTSPFSCCENMQAAMTNVPARTVNPKCTKVIICAVSRPFIKVAMHGSSLFTN